MPKSLLQAIRERQQAGIRKGFNYGISTAEPFVRSVRECVGSDICYRFASTRQTSFADVLQKAARTLVYSKDDMCVHEVDYQKKPGANIKELDGITLPKNTLMVFRHTLTSPKEDRDGDILRSEGARLDEKMLLLWQHVPTLPIGKLLRLEEQDEKGVRVVSCIVDMNELSHDAAVMVDNDMARFSHGFRALDFEEIRSRKGEPTGFDVKEYEVMEESLVSVPSNTDANTEEVILSLVEGGKMTSAIMKEYGKSIRDGRSISLNFEKGLPEEGDDDADDGKTKEKAGGCTCGKGKRGASEETKEGAEEEGTEGTDNTEVDGENKDEKTDGVCPQCGSKLKEGKCEKCGYEMGKSAPLGREYVQESIQNVITYATREEKQRLVSVLGAMEQVEKNNEAAKFFQSVTK